MKFERTQPKVSIVLASWFKEGQNGKYGENETAWFADECIRKLIENTPKELYELIVIDNGSTLSGMIDVLTLIDDNNVRAINIDSYWDKANVLIRNKENLGFAPAYNQGFALARGEYVICMNNDVIVYPGWLEAMLEAFEATQNPSVGVVMPALMKETRDAREALKIEKPDITQNKGILGPQAEFGSLWMMKRELLEQLKDKDGYYFDEQFLVGFKEDRDLWKRVRREGYETYRTHNTRVFHQGGMSMSKIENKKEFTAENKLKFEKKWNINNHE